MGIRYIYFVSYHTMSAEGNGLGNAEVEISAPISRAADITMIADYLKEKNNWDGVVILNYQLMREEYCKSTDKET